MFKITITGNLTITDIEVINHLQLCDDPLFLNYLFVHSA